MAINSVSKDGVVDIFKIVYGKANDLRPGKDIIDDLFPFEATQKVGQAYVEDMILGDEVGITFAGTAQDAFAINAAIAGPVKQTSIVPSQTALSSVLSWAFMARSAEGGEEAFFQGTKFVMKNHLDSHNKFISVAKLYGQSTELLGYVSYAPAGTIYRNSNYTAAGNIVLTKKDGTTITFTAGINAAGKNILLAPGQYAAGFWVSRKNVMVLQVDASNNVVASGSLVSTDATLGYITVDFTPVAATSTTSHRLCFVNWDTQQEMVGAHRIITNTGTLFGVSAATYDLWSGQVVNLNGTAWTMRALQEGVADAINAGGLDEELDVVVNPRTFGRIAADESTFRKYDTSYKTEARNGFSTIEYYAANGTNRIHASSKVKEGHVFGFVKSLWRCSGSQLPSFKVSGINMDVIFPLQDNAGFVVRSYGDQYLFCRMPAKQILWTNCNDEGAPY